MAEPLPVILAIQHYSAKQALPALEMLAFLRDTAIFQKSSRDTQQLKLSLGSQIERERTRTYSRQKS